MSPHDQGLPRRVAIMAYFLDLAVLLASLLLFLAAAGGGLLAWMVLPDSNQGLVALLLGLLAGLVLCGLPVAAVDLAWLELRLAAARGEPLDGDLFWRSVRVGLQGLGPRGPVLRRVVGIGLAAFLAATGLTGSVMASPGDDDASVVLAVAAGFGLVTFGVVYQLWGLAGPPLQRRLLARAGCAPAQARHLVVALNASSGFGERQPWRLRVAFWTVTVGWILPFGWTLVRTLTRSSLASEALQALPPHPPARAEAWPPPPTLGELWARWRDYGALATAGFVLYASGFVGVAASAGGLEVRPVAPTAVVTTGLALVVGLCGLALVVRAGRAVPVLVARGEPLLLRALLRSPPRAPALRSRETGWLLGSLGLALATLVLLRAEQPAQAWLGGGGAVALLLAAAVADSRYLRTAVVAAREGLAPHPAHIRARLLRAHEPPGAHRERLAHLLACAGLLLVPVLGPALVRALRWERALRWQAAMAGAEAEPTRHLAAPLRDTA